MKNKQLKHFFARKAFLLIALLSASMASVAATNSAMDDFVFSWLENNYGSYFAPASSASQTAGGYYYRYYAKTNSYLGEKDGELYYVIGGVLGGAGKMSAWASKAGFNSSSTSTGTTGSTGEVSSTAPATIPTGPITPGKALALEYAVAQMQSNIDGGNSDNLISFQFQTTPGYVIVNCTTCRHQNWRLPMTTSNDQYTAFQTAYNAYMQVYTDGSDPYVNAEDIAGFTSYTEKMIAQYSAMFSQIPAAYSVYWF